ncbi:MAG: inositol monophosphatase family protein, partial [Petrotogales bacterium]
FAQQIVKKIDRKIKRETKQNFYKMSNTIDIGADGTPTKYIDKIAEDVAIKNIKKSNIKVNLLSEEAGLLDFGGDYTFVLDPIDGTRNAYRGIPFYSVSLAIGKSTMEDVEYGIVKNIPTGDIFIAEKNRGAFLNNMQISVSDVPSNELFSSVAMSKNSDPKTISLIKKHNVRSLGAASLEMCMVATGAIDFYYVGREFMRVVDIAASSLIVREAGGFVTNLRGEKLNMALTLDERTGVVAACSEDLIHDLISWHKK